ncbi:hypothetical protein HK104_001707, partial [Borealophlyctis nickersoniae]
MADPTGAAVHNQPIFIVTEDEFADDCLAILAPVQVVHTDMRNPSETICFRLLQGTTAQFDRIMGFLLRLWEAVTTTWIYELNVNSSPRSTGGIIIFQKASDTVGPAGRFPEYEAPLIHITLTEDGEYLSKLWETGKLSDCTVVCDRDQKEFRTHRIFLCRIPYFDRALCSTLSEARALQNGSQTRCTIPAEFTSDAVHAALHYLYEGDKALLSKAMDILVETLSLADFLIYAPLLQSCKRLISHEVAACANLKGRILAHLINNYETVVSSKEYAEFMQEHPDADRSLAAATDKFIMMRFETMRPCMVNSRLLHDHLQAVRLVLKKRGWSLAKRGIKYAMKR